MKDGQGSGDSHGSAGQETLEPDDLTLSDAEPSGAGSTVPEEGTVVDFPETDHRQRQRRRRIGLIVGIVSAVLLGTLVAVLYYSPLLALRTIDVTGTDLLPAAKAQQLLQPLTGRPLPQVGTREVEGALADEPAVDQVRVQAQPPHGIAVEIMEHTPVALIPQGDQATLYSSAGEPLAQLTKEEAEKRGLPAVSSVSDVQNPEVFTAITEVLGSLPDDIRGQMVSASASTVDSVRLTLQDDRTVLWGNAEQAESKVAVLRALMKAEADAEQPADEFDVSIPDQPVTR